MTLNFKSVTVCLFFLITAVTGQQEKSRTLPIPTEEESGRVFIASLFIDLAANLPDAVLVYPALYSKDGKIRTTNSFSALIEGKAVEEFLDILAHPTSIGTADETCPNVLLAWYESGQQQNKGARPLIGLIAIDPDSDRVRVRLQTDDSFYMRIDFVYEKTGLKSFLEQRSTTPSKGSP